MTDPREDTSVITWLVATFVLILVLAILVLGYKIEYEQYDTPAQYVQCDDIRPRNC